jgi:hypothetical protein
MFAPKGSNLRKPQAEMSENPAFLRRFGQNGLCFLLVDPRTEAHIVAARH